jgi:hypothetical protein
MKASLRLWRGGLAGAGLGAVTKQPEDISLVQPQQVHTHFHF